ncbi:glucose-1-phosphate adenylyltransferase [bacterium]|nr:glucose-1-phosphate adenylyltransferase [bacterium]
MIMAGGGSRELSVLTEVRADAAVEFAGKYRLIDFPLSNCVNSDIYNVAVLTQYRPQSLNAHIGTGTPWDLDLSKGGVRVLQPYRGGKYGDWQKGNADAVRRNLDYVLSQDEEHVLILSGDHVYTMDYRPLLQFHADNKADLTVCVRNVNIFEAHRYGIVLVSSDNSVYGYDEKPKRAKGSLANMGIYVFRKEFLVKLLTEHPEFNDFGRDILPYIIKGNGRVFARYCPGYWADLGNIQAYWEANMSLLAEDPALDLYDQTWTVHTRSTDQAPVYIDPEAKAGDSILCNGSQVYGEVSRCVIASGVVVEPGAVVKNSVIMNNVRIGRGAVVDNCVIDKDVVIGENAKVGAGEDVVPNREIPGILNTGLTLIGRGRRIAPEAVIGRSVIIHPNHAIGVQEEVGGEIASGSSVGESER